MSSIPLTEELNSILSIESYSSGYADEVVGLILSIQQNEFQIPITLDQQPDLRTIEDFYQSGHGGFWIAKYANRVIGTIALLDIGNECVALRKMFVHPDFRGAQYKTAKLLLNFAQNHAIKLGISSIYLGTTDKFQAAHRFYEKNGFVEIKKTGLPQLFPIMQVDSKFYHKKLV